MPLSSAYSESETSAVSRAAAAAAASGSGASGSSGSTGSSMSNSSNSSGAYNGPSSTVPVNRANADFKLAKQNMATTLFSAKRNKVFAPFNKEDTGVVIARGIHQVNNSIFKKKDLSPKAPHIASKLKRL